MNTDKSMDIARFETTKRLSRAVVHGGVAYLAGVTAADPAGDIGVQTRSVLKIIEDRLVSVGTSKERILSAQIWLKDIERDFASMNVEWEAWLPEGAAPSRATAEAKLASPSLLVEIIVTAAI